MTATTAPPQPLSRRVWSWTRDDFFRLGEHGFFGDRRVELIGGEIVEMSPINYPHTAALQLTRTALERIFGPAYWARIQDPLALGPSDVPQPDIAVVPGGPRDYTDHPTTAVLVVEVADTTLATDRTDKAALYAAHGIEDYWIVDVNGRALEVYRRPGPGGYADVTVHRPPAAVAPLAAPAGAAVAVADLLP